MNWYSFVYSFLFLTILVHFFVLAIEIGLLHAYLRVYLCPLNINLRIVKCTSLNTTSILYLCINRLFFDGVEPIDSASTHTTCRIRRDTMTKRRIHVVCMTSVSRYGNEIQQLQSVVVMATSVRCDNDDDNVNMRGRHLLTGSLVGDALQQPVQPVPLTII